MIRKAQIFVCLHGSGSGLIFAKAIINFDPELGIAALLCGLSLLLALRFTRTSMMSEFEDLLCSHNLLAEKTNDA